MKATPFSAFIACVLLSLNALAEGPAVLVKTVTEQAIIEPYEAIGRVEATESVDVIARVSGILEERLFEEGTSVTVGQALFQIEKAPYEIKVKQQKANLAGTKATLKQAEAELARNKRLRKSGAVSKAELEVAEANRDQSKAQVLQAEAALEQAELELSYTQIISPINGSIGKSSVSHGNLVAANTTQLATIVSTDPVYVEIAVSDKLLLDLRKEGPIDTDGVIPQLILSDHTLYPHNGSFNFVDPQISRNTDTISIRTSFPNPDGVLLPGQFVKMQITPKDIPLVVAVPQAAVQRDRQGTFVMIVNADNKIEQKRVVLGEQVRGQWIITSGIKAGDRVVIEGLQKIQPGIQVQASEIQ